jgi:hypothetical protein
LVLNCVNKDNEICINFIQSYESYENFIEAQEAENKSDLYKGPNFQTLNKVKLF